MSGPRRIAARKFLAVMFVATLFVASITSGACLCGGFPAGHEEGGASLISIDVCGTGAASILLQGLVTLAVCCGQTGPYFPEKSLIPPSPAKAVASAEPGETEKPPEA